MSICEEGIQKREKGIQKSSISKQQTNINSKDLKHTNS